AGELDDGRFEGREIGEIQVIIGPSLAALMGSVEGLVVDIPDHQLHADPRLSVSTGIPVVGVPSGWVHLVDVDPEGLAKGMAKTGGVGVDDVELRVIVEEVPRLIEV